MSVSLVKQSSSNMYRHDPYAFNPFLVPVSQLAATAAAPEKPSAAAAATKDRVLSSAGFALPVPASVAAAKAKSLTIETAATHHDDGVSDAGSDVEHSPIETNFKSTVFGDSMTPLSGTLTAAIPAAVNTTNFRYASVNFRFGSAWFLAPFRTHVGDMVVVQYPTNGSLHMGLVSCITTVKPTTFYSEDNIDPNYLSEEDIVVLPRLLRHAREFDRETKLDLRSHDLASLASAQALAEEMGAPVTFLDAEWLLDLSAVTFLVHVYGEVTLVDRLADELAAQEGAEVVFTYPAASC